MSIIKLFKKLYKEVLFLLMVTSLILSIIKLFQKSNKEYFHLHDTFYNND